MVVPGGWAFSYERGTPVSTRDRAADRNSPHVPTGVMVGLALKVYLAHVKSTNSMEGEVFVRTSQQ